VSASETVIVCVRTQGPVNLGMIARTCRNLGIDHLRLVDPLCEVDCADARRFANHACDFLLAAPRYRQLEDAIGDCGLAIATSGRSRDATHGPPLGLDDVPGLCAQRPGERIALVFGNDADGLDRDELRACQALLRLEAPGDYPIYNLAQAVAIVAHRFVLPPVERPAPRTDPAAPRAHVERLYTYWMNTLERFGYFRHASRERYAPKVRQLVNNLHFTRDDLDIVFGMFAQFHHRAFGDKGHHLIATDSEEGGEGSGG